MIIRNNIGAIRTYNNLQLNNRKVETSIERLSSGTRINRSSDDVASFGISEKIRLQIKGLNQANKNIQNGISLLQTGDGALREISSILQRMRELSVQASNGTYTESDRIKMQGEISELSYEIDRILKDTTFNGLDIFGSNNGTNKENEVIESTEALIDSNISSGSKAVASGVIKLVSKKQDKYDINLIFKTVENTDELNGYSINFEVKNKETSVNVVESKNKQEINVDIKKGKYVIRDLFSDIESKINNILDKKIYIENIGEILTDEVFVDLVSVPHDKLVFGSGSSDDVATSDDSDESLDGTTDNKGSIKIQVGANSNENIEIKIDNINLNSLGINLSVNLLTRENSQKSIDVIDKAISKVSLERSKLGAYENRLYYSINNVSTMKENLINARSRIMDVDMAREIIRFTKNSMLSNVSQTIFSHSNTMGQSILNVLINK